MKAKKRETAAEFMARLQSDPEWVRQDAERRAAQEARTRQRLKDIEPEHTAILAELTAAGVKVRMNPKIQLTLAPEARPGRTPIPVGSIDDLLNTRDSYPEAIPILIRHLRVVQQPIMLDCIARALTVKEACGTDAPRLVLERLKLTEPVPAQCGDNYQARWALANALTVIADTSMIDEMKALVADARYQDVKGRLDAAVKRLGAG